MTRKTTFYEGWSWFKFNNLGLALGMALRFYTSGKWVKTKSYSQFLRFVEVTGENLVCPTILRVTGLTLFWVITKWHQKLFHLWNILTIETRQEFGNEWFKKFFAWPRGLAKLIKNTLEPEAYCWNFFTKIINGII